MIISFLLAFRLFYLISSVVLQYHGGVVICIVCIGLLWANGNLRPEMLFLDYWGNSRYK